MCRPYKGVRSAGATAVVDPELDCSGKSFSQVGREQPGICLAAPSVLLPESFHNRTANRAACCPFGGRTGMFPGRRSPDGELGCGVREPVSVPNL